MTHPDTRHRLDGLEPDNLLAFLALLGLLRALAAARPCWRPRVAWDLEKPPVRPLLVLADAQTRESVCVAAADGAAKLAAHYHFSQEIGMDAPRQSDLTYTAKTARTLLQDVAETQDRERADLWSALMCDAAQDEGKIEATPLCLLFGQGHQHFLDRLADVPRMDSPPPRGRGKKAVVVSAAETLQEALFLPWTRSDPTPAFRWDPAEDVRYALQADNPSSDKSLTQHGANRLAALGLPVLTVTPVQRGERVRLQIVGGRYERTGFVFYWPIWRDPASLATIRMLLAHPELSEGPARLAHLGIVEVRQAHRISVGKFMNITWADPILVDH
ncbi:MAG: hypothetical protein QOJ54_1322 [Aliidongia sp.]|nr:hypothetical protein [Aliidongia sp.]